MRQVGIRSKQMALQIGGYDRIVRHRGNGIEAVEIVWHPGTRTPKHNHSSRGWVWVLRGRIFEVKNGSKVYHEAGAYFLETHREEAHIVGNDTKDLAVTFHVYQPELQMDTFPDGVTDILAVDLTDVSKSASAHSFDCANRSRSSISRLSVS
jgi:quercetin dioxygenase-like cupin family protein